MFKSRKLLVLLSLVTLVLMGCAPSVTPFANNSPSPTPLATTKITMIATEATLSASSTPTLAPTTTVSTSSLFANPTPVLEVNPTSTATSVSTPPPTFTPVIAPTPTPRHQTQFQAAPAGVTPTVPSTLSTPAIPPSVPPIPLPTQPVLYPANATPDAEEQKFINILNAYRQANRVGPLSFDARLFHSARWMAQDMATKNYVAHVDSLNRSIPQRINAFGYPGPRVGENIAGGFEFAQDNLNIWQSDQIHKDNLLGKYYTHIGVGRFYQAGSFNRWYWVLDMD